MGPESDLDRFLQAQEPVLTAVRQELAAGQKRSHWMWFIFPQLRGLGRSSTAQFYGLASLDEARAYWTHPQLGARLRECTQLVSQVQDRTVHQIFGSPDDLKFHSCLTLFARVDPSDPTIQDALRKYFAAVPDEQTTRLLD